MPELFLYEIGKLTEDERKRYRKRRYEITASDGVLTTAEQYQMALLNKTYEVDKINEMNFYLFFQRKDFHTKYRIFLDQAISWGWETHNSYLYSLTVKDEASLTSIEKLMLEELKEHKLIEEEIMTLIEAINNREPEVVLPFPMEEGYKREYLAMLEHSKKFRSVDIHDTMFIPYELPTETFMDRLRKLPDVDIDKEIKLC
jgi:hypothetical protein